MLFAMIELQPKDRFKKKIDVEDWKEKWMVKVHENERREAACQRLTKQINPDPLCWICYLVYIMSYKRVK